MAVVHSASISVLPHSRIQRAAHGQSSGLFTKQSTSQPCPNYCNTCMDKWSWNTRSYCCNCVVPDEKDGNNVKNVKPGQSANGQPSGRVPLDMVNSRGFGMKWG